MFTPLAGLWHGDYSGEWLFPLWGRRKSTSNERTRIHFLWGYYRRNPGGSSSSSFFPFYGYKNSSVITKEGGCVYRKKSFLSLPICWYNHEERVKPVLETVAEAETSPNPPETMEKETNAGIFPLYYFKRRAEESSLSNRARLEWNLAWRLFDYRAEHDSKREDGGVDEEHHYTRSRVLWRVYHRETLNGAASTDMFPGISTDRTADGRRSWSVLWHFLAYKQERDGGRKIHVLFIPIRIRKG